MSVVLFEEVIDIMAYRKQTVIITALDFVFLGVHVLVCLSDEGYCSTLGRSWHE